MELPDGRRFAADDPAGHRVIGRALGRDVTLAPEAAVPHHDEGPVSLITTAALRRLTELSGGEPGGAALDPLRFRANLLLDVPGTGFPEDDWPGRLLRVGTQAVLRVVRPLTRCVMIDLAQDGAAERNDLLKTPRRTPRPDVRRPRHRRAPGPDHHRRRLLTGVSGPMVVTPGRR